MPGTIIERRKKIHEFVEKGDILGAVKEESGNYGFTKFPLSPEFSYTFGVNPIFDGTRTKIEEDKLYLGPEALYELKQISRIDAELAGKRIEHKVSHEGGHVFKPRDGQQVNGKSAPWNLEEIIASQDRKGTDIFSDEAVAQQEAQANIYAAVKCHEERSLDELLDVMAGQFWTNSIHGFYDELETESSTDRNWAVRKLAEQYASLAGYTLWMKPQGVHRIVEKVVEIDERYHLRSQKASRNI